MEIWKLCAGPSMPTGQRYSLREQQAREKAYDKGLRAVERQARKISQFPAERIGVQCRIIELFAQFSAVALDLSPEAVKLLENDFLPIGVSLAQWAKRFDSSLTRADILQACRNAWTACGLQPLLGERPGLTPAILAYSLLYPYSDNYLDCTDISNAAKSRFNERFRERLLGEEYAARDQRERAIWALVELIEGQYPRISNPQIFDCLLAIHRAQDESVSQQRNFSRHDQVSLLQMSCAKGGTSVLADACLVRGRLSEEESKFSFEWGSLLQLGDDLQDVREDLLNGSMTLFSYAAASGKPLDGLLSQLLNFCEQVTIGMNNLTNGSELLKGLLRMSWRSLIIGAIADSYEYFSASFLAEAEQYSPFRFEFLRKRRKRLAARQGLYAALFDAFLESGTESNAELGMGLPAAFADPAYL